MIITVLMEDTCRNSALCCEHGLSLFIEAESHTLLADTGASQMTIKNMDILGKRAENVDIVFLSHGHYDHSGGIMDFCKRNDKAKIYVSNGFDGDYYNGEKYIGVDKRIAELDNLITVDEYLKIDDSLSVFGKIKGRELWPQSNLLLSKCENGVIVQDDFSHEQCLVIEENGKKVLISGCAHNGILNILSRFFEIYGEYPFAVISGFHMMKKTEYNDEEIKNIKLTAERLKKLPSVFYTGHCTGESAYKIMKDIMGEKLNPVFTGEVIEI